MNETYVRLLCPECQKAWQSPPDQLPRHDQNFSCPNCHATRQLAEFTRTDRDLETLKSFQV